MDTPDALSISPVSAEPSIHANEGNHHTAGSGESLAGSALAQQIERASAGAVEQHLGETKRSRGQRGPDKRPRAPRAARGANPVPLGSLGNGTGETLLEEGTPQPLGGFVEIEPAFDESTAREMVEIAVGLLNDGAAAVIRAIAKKETGDDLLAEEAAKNVRMSEKIETAVKVGAVKCAEKYAVRLDYAPELMLGGGLVIWAGQVSLHAKALRTKGAEIREREKKAAA